MSNSQNFSKRVARPASNASPELYNTVPSSAAFSISAVCDVAVSVLAAAYRSSSFRSFFADGMI